MKNFAAVRFHMFHCEGKACQKAGAFDLTQALRDEVEKHGLKEEFHTTRTLCNGACECAPIVVLQPQGLVYGGLKPADAPRCIQNWVQSAWRTPEVFPIAEYGFCNKS
jgi:(2Fe-2S) ferredoxin